MDIARGLRGGLPTVAFWAAVIFCLPVHAQQSASAHYGHHGKVLLPDLQATPGDTLTADVATVCAPGYARSVRNVSPAEKRQVYLLYRARPSVVQTRNGQRVRTCCEVDHLISLELGGSNDIKNLWPQPYFPGPGAHQKDVLENWLHQQVCTGRTPLEEAQKTISSDWYEAYLRMKGRD